MLDTTLARAACHYYYTSYKKHEQTNYKWIYQRLSA